MQVARVQATDTYDNGQACSTWSPIRKKIRRAGSNKLNKAYLTTRLFQCNGMNPYGKTLEELNGGEFEDARDVPFCNADAGLF